MGSQWRRGLNNHPVKQIPPKARHWTLEPEGSVGPHALEDLGSVSRRGWWREGARLRPAQPPSSSFTLGLGRME